jgi:hypothetical protein
MQSVITHAKWIDVSINIACLAVVMYLTNKVAARARMSSNLGAAIGFTVFFGVTYLAAELFHASFVIYRFMVVFHGINQSLCLGFLYLVLEQQLRFM